MTKNGHGNNMKIQTEVNTTYTYLACCIWTHGKRSNTGKRVAKALANAKVDIEAKLETTLLGKNKLQDACNLFFIKSGPNEEGGLVENVQQAVKTLEQVLACDEKLF